MKRKIIEKILYVVIPQQMKYTQYSERWHGQCFCARKRASIEKYFWHLLLFRQADPILCMDVFLSPLNGSEAHGVLQGGQLSQETAGRLH